MAQVAASQTPIASATAPRTFELQAEYELRFEIPPDVSTASLKLEAGAAELFGIELARNRVYTLPPSFYAAVFTWHGATLILQGTDAVDAYTATETPMPSYVSAHSVLQSKRLMAKSAGLPGPRAIVAGPRDCGKTAVVTMLASYCIKANGVAHVVDLDPSGCGAAGSMPGSISISSVSHVDVDVGGLVHEKTQSVMLGHTSPKQNQAVSEAIFTAMGEIMDSVLSTAGMNPSVGCVVDTCGDVDGKCGTETVVLAAKALKADVVFVLGSERLYASIRSTFEHSATETVLLSKSGGVVSRDESARRALQSSKVRHYFYGVDNSFNPYSTTVDFGDVTVLKVGGAVSVVPDSVLPAGAESSLDPLKPVVLTSMTDLLHKILGVSQAEKEEDVVKAPLFGYVHVVRLDSEKNVMTVLAPSPGIIPGRFFVAGDVTWIE